MFLPQEIIKKKRDGEPLDPKEIGWFIEALAKGRLSDAQIGAFAMAVYLKGMDVGETVALTLAMRSSGDTLDWSDLPGPVLDKHSTGGVGDKVSLILAPMLAAVGAYVPMISGRGLGHTGGTLDKLESIEGYKAYPDIELFRKSVKQVGCAIVGATSALAPADKRLYAVRDVTATVESLPLITASILSKKLAAGPHGLVMDVKTGSGAFMANLEDARALARSLVDVGCGAGLPTTALMTDMSQVLGRNAGNALEVVETIEFLKGEAQEPRLLEVSLALGGALLAQAGIADGEVKLNKALTSGAAFECFAKMVRELGGCNAADDTGLLPKASIEIAIEAPRSGTIATIDTRAIGMAIVGLGGGRAHPNDVIDHAVGLSDVLAIGSKVERGDALAIVHARSEAEAINARASMVDSFEITDGSIEPPPVVYEQISS